MYERLGEPLRLSEGSDPRVLDDAGVSDPLRHLWRFANGSRGPVFQHPGSLSTYRLLDVEAALSQQAAMKARAPQYEGWNEPEPRDPRIRPGWFHDGWLAFASFHGSLLLIEDRSPAPAGTAGQIIGFVHDPDQIVYVAASLGVLLERSIEAIEADPEEFSYGISA